MEKVWDEYPRPQMKRDSFYNLNGIWKLNGEKIVVPFPPQSKLSGFEGEIGDVLVYEKEFTVPSDFDKKRILMNFGAVDQIATVWINDKQIGSHKGGYWPFYFDVTEYVDKENNNVLKVVAIDTLDKNYPYGKQTKKPGGMWYTEVSGIWQSVWLENVPEKYVEGIKIDADLNGVSVEVFGNEEVDGFKVKIGDGNEKEFHGSKGRIDIDNPKLWTVDKPYLYSMEITMGEDKVESYFALRTIEIKDINGVNRVCLNGEPIFFNGVLDQGYFHDGIFLPRCEKEYEKDILRMKELGFNMLRKHIKIEPECFYYACDKLGMLVMQDMVNTGCYSFVKDTALPTVGFKKKNDRKRKMTVAMENFKVYTKETIEKLYNHPCIVAYTIFNEGWGQFNSDYMYEFVKELDDSRLIDSASGWYAQEKNDFDSEHIYFKTKKLKVKDRPLFVTECGGYQLFDEAHFYGSKKYGYGTCKDKGELTERIVNMYEKMILPEISEGVCGCIYTQLSDVEDEINGLYTYDRVVCKVDANKLFEMNKKINRLMKKI
ncbi:MAG: glycoside hydrolase family 2 [Lachnospiraceae bacterium]|nr:glycoside hydrolase family 2 [Lachnospiraceae bacterium]